MAGALPTFVVIGAQKCGTTALHRYLGLHPEVATSTPKELDFFLGWSAWRQGVDWYRSHFDPARPARGESSPNYTSAPHRSRVPERMASVVPDARLVYLVRDPLARIAAQWVHNRAVRREDRGPAEAIADPRTTYLARSCYMAQIDRFLEHYPRERLLVLEQRELRDDRDRTLERVFAFLGVDPAFRSPAFATQAHATVDKRRPSAAGAAVARRLRQTPLGGTVTPAQVARWEGRFVDNRVAAPDAAAIADVLAPDQLDLLRTDAARLREFTGRPLGHWTV